MNILVAPAFPKSSPPLDATATAAAVKRQVSPLPSAATAMATATATGQAHSMGSAQKLRQGKWG